MSGLRISEQKLVSRKVNISMYKDQCTLGIRQRLTGVGDKERNRDMDVRRAILLQFKTVWGGGLLYNKNNSVLNIYLLEFGFWTVAVVR